MQRNLHLQSVLLRLINAALVFSVIVCCVGANVTVASAQVYISDLVSSNPKLMRAWSRVLPNDLRGVDWIGRFGGPTTPVEVKEVGGKKYFLGWACKAHDCGGNEVSFLIAVDGSSAYGAITSSSLGIPLRFVGKPGSQVQRLLKTKFGS